MNITRGSCASKYESAIRPVCASGRKSPWPGNGELRSAWSSAPREAAPTSERVTPPCLPVETATRSGRSATTRLMLGQDVTAAQSSIVTSDSAAHPSRIVGAPPRVQ
jgi:hypothetical protein